MVVRKLFVKICMTFFETIKNSILAKLLTNSKGRDHLRMRGKFFNFNNAHPFLLIQLIDMDRSYFLQGLE